MQQSWVLLVYDPSPPRAPPSAVEKEKHLNEVAEELLKMVTEAADIKTETIPVEKRWHKALIGKDGNPPDLLTGEDKTISVKFGADADDSSTEDVVWRRGIKSDVDAAVQKTQKLVEDAKEDAIASSYSTELEIDKEFVGRIVGAYRANIDRLKEQFDIRRVDIIDDTEQKEKEKELSKKKPVPHNHKVKFKITGRKEEAEAAKKTNFDAS